MKKQKARVIHSEEVKSFVIDETYSSKMLLDHIVAGDESVHVNEGTLKGGYSTGGGTHEFPEIYYVVKGNAYIYLDDETFDIGPSSLVNIPAGVFHSLKNKSETEDFVLLTIWKSVEGNDVYDMRVKAWGKSFKTIYEDEV